MLCEHEVVLLNLPPGQRVRGDPLPSVCASRSCAVGLVFFVRTLAFLQGPVYSCLGQKLSLTKLRFLWALFLTRPWLWTFVSVLAKSSFSKNPSKSAYLELLLRISSVLNSVMISFMYISVLCPCFTAGLPCLGFEPKSIWHQSLQIPAILRSFPSVFSFSGHRVWIVYVFME